MEDYIAYIRSHVVFELCHAGYPYAALCWTSTLEKDWGSLVTYHMDHTTMDCQPSI